SLFSHPSLSSSTSISNHFSPFPPTSSSLAPPIAHSSSPFPSPDHFAAFFTDHTTYLTQDQYPLSTGQDILDLSSQSWELYDDPLQALLSTGELNLSNSQSQILTPSIDHSPIQTPVSKDGSLHSMKDSDSCLLDIHLAGDAGDSFRDVNSVPTVTTRNSSRTPLSRPEFSSTTVPEIGLSPESSSSSTTKSSSNRKRPRVDDDSRSTEEIANEKRHRNTMAARRFRKRKEDRICSLEKQLADALRERDELKLQVARLEGQNMMLRTCQDNKR
ncbi:bZIP transcription factor JlbA/IDI-4, partial [Trichophyton benhamiae CBS 112371]